MPKSDRHVKNIKLRKEYNNRRYGYLSYHKLSGEASTYHDGTSFGKAAWEWVVDNLDPVSTKMLEKRKNVNDAKKKKYLTTWQHIFKRDKWVCIGCGEKIKDKFSARAYNPMRKSDEPSVECAIYMFTLCQKCYSKAIRKTGCSRYKMSEKECDDLMVPPTLMEILDNNLGKGHERWLHVDV
jgi:hypothetical protein